MTKVVAVVGDKNSMSSLALLTYHPMFKLHSCKKMPEVIEYIKQGQEGFLPFWNSHAGEVTQSTVIDSLDNEEVMVTEMLPEEIKFSCISKQDTRVIKEDKVISVHVAEQQCSAFINETGIVFTPGASTTQAFDRFKKEDFKAFLGAKENIEDTAFHLYQENVSNPYNFTSFALLQKYSPQIEGEKILSLVEMPNPSENDGSIQHMFLDTLFGDSGESMDDLAKPTFIRLKEDGRIHLIIEHHDEAGEDIISEDSDELEVTTKKIGSLDKPYGLLAKNMLSNTFGLNNGSHDFLKHIGTQSCLFFCPALNIYLHGYNAGIVEDFIRRVLEKYFVKYSEGLSINGEQQVFFDRNFDAFKASSMREFEFVDIAML